MSTESNNTFLDKLKEAEDGMSKAWSGDPPASVKATFYLGMAEAISMALAQPQNMKALGEIACTNASRYSKEHRIEMLMERTQMPWWKKIFGMGL